MAVSILTVTITHAGGSPELTADTVFFIGNGVLRVAPADTDGHESRMLSPSWSEYMDDLWSFIGIPSGTADFLSLEDFSHLSAPRQAEWFDRVFTSSAGPHFHVPAL